MAYRKKTEPTRTLRITLDESEYAVLSELAKIQNKAVARFLVDFLRDGESFKIMFNMLNLIKEIDKNKDEFKKNLKDENSLLDFVVSRVSDGGKIPSEILDSSSI
ncbi:hypothetical protein [Actinobacillus pleuropneumoniae]|uniref:hypothetical protein n=1 Tax=Actinobacillus pleuropneumoniae TaxID=715 RepID=UPI003B0124B0